MKREIHPALAGAVIVTIVASLGGYWFLSQRTPPSGASSARVVGGKRLPSLGYANQQTKK